MANSADPDQMPHSVASNTGLCSGPSVPLLRAIMVVIPKTLITMTAFVPPKTLPLNEFAAEKNPY